MLMPKEIKRQGFPLWGGAPQSYDRFRNLPAPYKTDVSLWGALPQLKNEFPPLKREPPSMKWFLGKSQQITQNLAKILEKYAWRSLFLVNLQACRLIADNFTNKWTPSYVFFNSVLTPPPHPLPKSSTHVLNQVPPRYILKLPPSHVLSTCGKPCILLFLPNIPIL